MNGYTNSKNSTQTTAALIAVVCLSTFLAGCASQQSQATDEVGPRQICLGDVARAEAMQAAQDALMDMHFNIQKADLTAGLIRTHPISGAQAFEFWRKDSVGSFNKKEANLHSIRRTVAVLIEKKVEGMCVFCEVTTQRLNLPEFEVSNSSRAYAMFSESSRSMQSMRLNPEQEEGIAWVDIGKDGQLANEILDRIGTKIAESGGSS